MLVNRSCLIAQAGDDKLLEVALQSHKISSVGIRIGADTVSPLAGRLPALSIYPLTSLIYQSPEMTMRGLLKMVPQTNRLVSCVLPLIEILDWFKVFRPHQLRTIVVSAPFGAGMETVVADQVAVLRAFVAGTTCLWGVVQPPDSAASPSSIAAMISDPERRPVPF